LKFAPRPHGALALPPRRVAAPDQADKIDALIKFLKEANKPAPPIRVEITNAFRPTQLTLRMHPVVTVKGKAFFDTHHAAKRPRLRNVNVTNKTRILAAWEIHPVSAITADRSVFPREVLGNHR
jgi:hypothetical protein